MLDWIIDNWATLAVLGAVIYEGEWIRRNQTAQAYRADEAARAICRTLRDIEQERKS